MELPAVETNDVLGHTVLLGQFPHRLLPGPPVEFFPVIAGEQQRRNLQRVARNLALDGATASNLYLR